MAYTCMPTPSTRCSMNKSQHIKVSFTYPPSCSYEVNSSVGTLYYFLNYLYENIILFMVWLVRYSVEMSPTTGCVKHLSLTCFRSSKTMSQEAQDHTSPAVVNGLEKNGKISVLTGPGIEAGETFYPFTPNGARLNWAFEEDFNIRL